MDFDSLQDDSQPAQTPQTQQIQTPHQDFDSLEDDSAKYGTPGQTAKAGIEGVAQGLLGPIATFAEKRYLGVSPEDIRGREEAHPYVHGAGEVAGLLSPVGQGAALAKAGEAVRGVMGLAKEAPALARIGGAAASNAAEMGLFQAGDELSKKIKEDPNSSAESALANMGMASAIGGALGGTLGAVNPLWKATVGDKVGQLLEDFKGRVNFRLNNPDVNEAFSKELSDYYHGIGSVADETFGPNGIKAQEIKKLVPEIHEGIVKQTGDISSKLEKSVQDLIKTDDPHAKLLQRELDKYRSIVSNTESTSNDMFNANQELKKQLQEWGKFNKDIVPLSERNFRTTAKDLAYDIRNSLEDSKVWGKAAERQQAINKAFSEYLPALKDFESKFTTKIGGERAIDPGKINTYLNQIGKPNAEIKQEMLKKFLEASEKYNDVLAKTHSNLGIEHPMPKSSLSTIKSTLQSQTAGSKLADKLIDHGLASIAGKSLGGITGGALGLTVGHPEIGFLLGEHALGPMFSSVLPAMTRPIMDSPSSVEGLKSAIDYGIQVVRGEKKLSASIKSVLNSAGEVVSSKSMPKEADRQKLDKSIHEIRENPEKFSHNQAGSVGNYLPEHQQALSKTTTQAAQYLAQKQPQPHKPGPLDKEIPPSEAQMTAYHRTLDLAINPNILLQRIKDGTLQISDLQDVKSMYPNYFNNICDKLTNEIAGAQANDETIPYKTKVSLSLCLGQPLESSMSPMAIVAAQPKATQAPQQASSTKSGQKSKIGNKTNDMYKTQGQEAESDRSARS